MNGRQAGPCCQAHRPEVAGAPIKEGVGWQVCSGFRPGLTGGLPLLLRLLRHRKTLGVGRLAGRVSAFGRHLP